MEENLQVNPDFLFAEGGIRGRVLDRIGARTTAISFTSSGVSGFSFSATSGGGSVYTVSIAVSNQAAARTSLGLGSLALLAAAGVPVDLSQSISNPPTQAEVQNIQAKLNALLGFLRS